MKYIILHDTSRHDLMRKVNEHLEQGWDLHGDLIAASTRIMPVGVRGEEITVSYSQAMIHISDATVAMNDFFAKVEEEVEDGVYDAISDTIRELNGVDTLEDTDG